MEETGVTRQFIVTGQIDSLFTPEGGVEEVKHIGGMTVELWHKGPLQNVFLGSTLTNTYGGYEIQFSCQSPNEMIVNGQISNVFVKVYYNNQLLTGGIDEGSGSFD